MELRGQTRARQAATTGEGASIAMAIAYTDGSACALALKRAAISLLVICAFIANVGAASLERGPRIILVFRYDDCRTPGDIEVSVLQAFRAHQMSCTFGIIPFEKPEPDNGPDPRGFLDPGSANVDVLRDAIRDGVLEAALHGYCHQNIRSASGGRATEWEGVPYERQVRKLNAGKRHLEESLGVRITTFIPPWNGYDGATLRALNQTGFECISASLRGTTGSKPALKFLPATCDLEQLVEAVQQARRLPGRRRVVVAMLHPFTFGEAKGFSVQDLGRVLDWVSRQTDIQVMTVHQAVKEIAGLDAETLTPNVRYQAGARLMPAVLRSYLFAEYAYVGRDVVGGQVLKVWTCVIVFYGGVLVLSFAGARAVGRVVFSRFALAARVSPYLILAALVGTTVYSLSPDNRNASGAVALSIALGTCIGFSLTLLRLRKKRLPDRKAAA